MKQKVSSNPYGLENIDKREKLNKERVEKNEKFLETIVDELKNITNRLDKIENKMNN